MSLFEVATCRVCGEKVTRMEAPLHAEDHAQRGEFPSTLPATPSDVLPPRRPS